MNNRISLGNSDDANVEETPNDDAEKKHNHYTQIKRKDHA